MIENDLFSWWVFSQQSRNPVLEQIHKFSHDLSCTCLLFSLYLQSNHKRNNKARELHSNTFEALFLNVPVSMACIYNCTDRRSVEHRFLDPLPLTARSCWGWDRFCPAPFNHLQELTEWLMRSVLLPIQFSCRRRWEIERERKKETDRRVKQSCNRHDCEHSFSRESLESERMIAAENIEWPTSHSFTFPSYSM